MVAGTALQVVEHAGAADPAQSLAAGTGGGRVRCGLPRRERLPRLRPGQGERRGRGGSPRRRLPCAGIVEGSSLGVG